MGKIKKPYILGVDPGLSGALAILCPKTGVLKSVWDVPTQPSGIKNRRTIDVASLSLKLGAYADDIAFAVVEEVHSTPNDGPVGAFAFGKSTGILLGVIGAYLIPVFQTPPAVWKNVFGLSKNKDESRALACKKFPLSKELFSLKKFDGRAEASLLAHFGKRFY